MCLLTIRTWYESRPSLGRSADPGLPVRLLSDVDQSANIMIFVSKGYFKSKNCIREATCTIAKAKPITLVHDPVRGGGSLEFIKNEECDTELRGIFEGRDIIVWHRIKVRAPCTCYASALHTCTHAPSCVCCGRPSRTCPFSCWPSSCCSAAQATHPPRACLSTFLAKSRCSASNSRLP